jgi:hypothetical protein
LSQAIYGEAYTDYSTAWLLSDVKRGGDRLRYVANKYGVNIGKRLPEGPLTDQEIGWYRLLMRAAHGLSLAPNIGARTSMLELLYQNVIAFQYPRSALDPLKTEAVYYVPNSIVKLTHMAPYREDLAAGFLSQIDKLTHDDKGLKVDILSRLLAIHPQHRSALWLLGKELATDPNLAQDGRAMMRDALALGVQRVYPVSDAEARALEDRVAP